MNPPAVWYLASPYSKFERGQEEAFKEACAAAATLLKRGVFVFSPIAHSHPIAEHGGIDALSHDMWMPLDLAMLDICDGLLVLMMPGWKESYGVQREIEHAAKTGKPISYFTWPMLTEKNLDH